MGRQKGFDDEERARQRVALEQARAEAEAEAEAAAVSRAERTRRFADGTLSIDDLNYNEIKEHLVRLCVPGKERIGKKEELRARLKVAYSTGKRKAVDDEIGAQQASAEKKAKRHL
jgi:hypothetical protein